MEDAYCFANSRTINEWLLHFSSNARQVCQLYACFSLTPVGHLRSRAAPFLSNRLLTSSVKENPFYLIFQWKPYRPPGLPFDPFCLLCVCFFPNLLSVRLEKLLLVVYLCIAQECDTEGEKGHSENRNKVNKAAGCISRPGGIANGS